MRRFVLAFAVLAVPFAVAAQTAPQQAQTTPAPTPVDAGQPTQQGTALQQPQTLTTQTTTQGGQVGEHVSSMTPEHALMHGALFGECVSQFAITGECPHDEEE